MGYSAKRFWPVWRIFLICLILVALTISAVLSWHSITGGTMAGCGGGSPCSHVLGSRWSVLAGIFPVSGLALGAYFAMLVAVFFTGADTEISVRRLAWGAVLVLSGSVAGSAVWFTFIQKRFIGEFCPYCMTAHISGLLIFMLVIWRVRNEYENLSGGMKNKVSDRHPHKGLFRPLQVVILVFCGLALAGLLAAVQLKYTPSTVNQEGTSQESQVVIDYQNAPMVGSPDAQYKVTLLFDYQCSHCQKIHFMLEEVVRRYEGKLAFVLCPAPLSRQCNPYILQDVEAFRNSCDLARIGLSVWFANREVFAEFENWMFTFESGNGWYPRSIEAARAKAVELVGHESFEAAWTAPQVEQYLQNSVRIYGQTIQGGRSGIPKMIYGSQWIIPEPYNADELVSILQKSLSVPLL